MPKPKLRCRHFPPDKLLSEAKGRNGWIAYTGASTTFEKWSFYRNGAPPDALRERHPGIILEPAVFTGNNPSWAMYLTLDDARDLIAKLQQALSGKDSF